MGYLKEFQKEIGNRDFAKFMLLWEEYCTSDSAPVEEMKEILQMIKASDFAPHMGTAVELLIPLVQTLQSPDEAYVVLQPLFDLQTTNTPTLADLAVFHVERRYQNHPKYQDLLRLTGLRSKDHFQGALSAMDLLAHLKVGNFVFHTGGWGTGEVMELSYIREAVVVEFENSPGQKTVTFANSMKSMIPLSEKHFFARRFGDADNLEIEAKKDPVSVVKMLLTDVGPMSAAEIKDAMAELVIPESEWAKWWQQARSKLKKDLSVETPNSLKDPFVIRKQTLSHEEEFLKQLSKKKEIKDILATCHSFSKEHPQELKNPQVQAAFLNVLKDLEKKGNISISQEVEIHLMRKNLFADVKQADLTDLMNRAPNLVDMIEGMDILQYKKQILMWVRENRPNWPDLFLATLAASPASLIRDYLIKELTPEKDLLEKYVERLIVDPAQNPDLFYWLFTRFVIQKKTDVPTKDSKEKWWESLLILLNRIENISTSSDLTKKIYLILTADRYQEVRTLFKDSSFEFTKEFLLLSSKCHTLDDRDQKSLKSLAGVRFPNLVGPVVKSEQEDEAILWTTEKGFFKTQERIRHIGTVETVDNAREIEAARALGDLRENSEYKFAKERRSRLQGEMKHLSEQIARARIITSQDVSSDEVSPGSVVEIIDPKGVEITYKILGPWDADADMNVLSTQSKLAQAMLGMRAGDTFQFKDEKFKIKSLKTIFD